MQFKTGLFTLRVAVCGLEEKVFAADVVFEHYSFLGKDFQTVEYDKITTVACWCYYKSFYIISILIVRLIG